MEDIKLTPIEVKVLKKCAKRSFNPDTAPIEEQDAEIRLIDIASKYEQDHNLISERIGYTEDCDLLVWFYDKVYLKVNNQDKG